jgi:putative ABC transport system permease protein
MRKRSVVHAMHEVLFLLASLALQNLGRRKARTLLLLMAVAICSGAVFTGAVLMQSIESSMSVGFTRLGADMLVVPAGTLTNITAALLTAEPTDTRRSRAEGP